MSLVSLDLRRSVELGVAVDFGECQAQARTYRIESKYFLRLSENLNAPLAIYHPMNLDEHLVLRYQHALL